MRSGSGISIVLFSGIALGITALPTVNSSAQQPSPPPPQFRTRTDVVLVDVSVLDRSRGPVRGLTMQDFTVLEDGTPQEIVAFKAVEVPLADAPSAKWMSRATLDVQSNDLPDGRLVLIYLDERSRSADPFFAQTAKNLANATIDQLAPNDVAAVAYVLDHRGTQEFTTDRGRLRQAVDAFAASPYVDISVVGTLRNLAAHLGAIPERRKVIIYIGSGEPFDMAVVVAMERTSSQPGAGPSLNNMQQRDLYDKLLDLFATAQRANVSIYTLDPMGLTVQKPNDPYAALQEPAKEFLRLLANNTGGRAVVNNNAPTAEIPAIVRENAAYYLIGFRPAIAGSEGHFRRIQVKVNRPNVEVRARRGYVEPKASAGGSPTTAVPPIGRLLPATDVRLSLSAIPIGPDTNGLNSVALAMSATLLPREGQASEHVSLSYAVLDMGGRERATGRRDFVVTPRDGASDTAKVQTLALEHLPPGRYDVRVSAQSAEGGRRGELIGDVTVPDFRKDVLSASGLIVEESPPPRVVPVDTLAGVLSGVPTNSRTFTSLAKVAASLLLYQALGTVPAVVTVKTQVIDGHDHAAFEATERLDPARFANGRAEYKFDLPLSRLAPGTYLLRCEASRSSSPVIRRDVRFEVK